VDSEHYFLGTLSYDTYPIASVEYGDFIIVVEGKIYGRELSVIWRELSQLALVFSDSPKNASKACGEWLLRTDGDFLIFIFDKSSNKTWVMNDVLGRLPVIAINPSSNTIECNRVHEFSFDAKANTRESVNDNAANLISLFTVACKERAAVGNNIVSLSGGLDSRSVAACLAANKIPFLAVTRRDSRKTSWNDAAVAETLARALGAEWSCINVGVSTGDDFLRLLRLKSGMNPLGMVSRISFLTEVQRVYRSGITYLTGDGGDKMFHDLRPARPLKTTDDLLRYIISEESIFSLEQVEKMSGISSEDVNSDLEAHLAAYPEIDLAQKYIHFVLFERAFKWLFEGEDRNRCYFWSVAPFYSVPLFQYAMGCSDSQKALYGLYRSFLVGLSPCAASVNNANWGIPITSNKSILYLMFKRAARRFKPGFTRLQRSTKAVIPNVYLDCLSRQLRNCPAIHEYMPYLAIEDIQSSGPHSNLSILLSLTSTIEDVCTGRSSLSYYRDAILQ
jgi:asparagine synthase (glutamine-hydrolysing)